MLICSQITLIYCINVFLGPRTCKKAEQNDFASDCSTKRWSALGFWLHDHYRSV